MEIFSKVTTVTAADQPTELCSSYFTSCRTVMLHIDTSSKTFPSTKKDSRLSHLRSSPVTTLTLLYTSFLYSCHTHFLAPSLLAHMSRASVRKKSEKSCLENRVRHGGPSFSRMTALVTSPFTFTVAGPHLGISWLSSQITCKNIKAFLIGSLQNTSKTKKPTHFLFLYIISIGSHNHDLSLQFPKGEEAIQAPRAPQPT